MYDYSTVLSYRDFDDTVYRKEILQCFNITEYSETINIEILALYEIVGSYYKQIIMEIKKNNNIAMLTGASSKECFVLLFSWEYFYENHNLLNAINAAQKMKSV